MTDLGRVSDAATLARHIAIRPKLVRLSSDPEIAAWACLERAGFGGETVGRIEIWRRLEDLFRHADRSKYLWTVLRRVVQGIGRQDCEEAGGTAVVRGGRHFERGARLAWRIMASLDKRIPNLDEFLELLELPAGAVEAPPIRDVEASRKVPACDYVVRDGLGSTCSGDWTPAGCRAKYPPCRIAAELSEQFRPSVDGYYFTGMAAEVFYCTGWLPHHTDIALVGHTKESATEFLQKLGSRVPLRVCRRTAKNTKFTSGQGSVTVSHTLWDDLPQLLDSGTHLATDANAVWTSPTQAGALAKYGALLRHIPTQGHLMDTIVYRHGGALVPGHESKTQGQHSALALEIELVGSLVEPRRVTDIGISDSGDSACRIAVSPSLVRRCSDPVVAALVHAQSYGFEAATLGEFAIQERLASLLRDADRSQYLWAQHRSWSYRESVAKIIRKLGDGDAGGGHF